MPRQRTMRFDGRKGLNESFSQEVLDNYEYRKLRNVRLAAEFGALTKVAGSQRIHVTAIGSAAAVLGLHQWQPAAGREVVAICGGNLYHKIQTDTNFTEVASSLSTTARPVFAPHLIAGTPTLYFADGALRKWTGAALTTSITGAPAAKYIVVYKGRMFASDGSKVLYWSDIEDPETWASPDGGQANAETYDTAGIQALAVVGSSLLLFKPNNIARFTGVSQSDIKVDQQTEGVSPDIGLIAPKTLVLFEEVAFFLTDRGPYIATEAGVQAVGTKIETAFDDAEMDHLPNAVAVHHKARREIWIFFPENTETTNTVGYCLNYRLQAWSGPWDMGDTFDVASAAQLERNDQTESVILGGYDGLVREGDVVAVDAKHDVLRDGTGGTAITMEVELPTLLFGDPTAIKRLSPSQHIAADLKTSGALDVIFSTDLMSGTFTTAIASLGAGVKQYLLRPGVVGRRITMSLKDATSEIIQLNGVALEAETHRRTA